MVASVALALLGPACSSSSSGDSGGCLSSPWSCGAGTTCWPQCGCTSGGACTLSNCTLTSSCLPSGTLQAGDSCSLTVGATKAPCGDGLTCVSYEDAGAGACWPYCDQNGGCPPGDECVALGFTAGGHSSLTEKVCLPPALVADAGLGLHIDGSVGSSSGTSSSSGGPTGDANWLDVTFDTTADSPMQH